MIACNVTKGPHRLLADLLRWRGEDAYKHRDRSTVDDIACVGSGARCNLQQYSIASHLVITTPFRCNG